MIKIEKNIPMPEKKSISVYAGMDDMNIGDSFSILGNREYNTAYRRSKRLGFTIAVRKQKDGSLRVWRTS
tara:strand:+ start:104 stop:313 length:210 start_codon:yes stop_codon:yes gene_type:complete